MKSIYCAGILTALVLTGCSQQSSEVIGPDTVIARYDGGEITLTDLDGFLLNQPSSRRWRAGERSTDWLASVIKRMTTDRLLLDEARLVGADNDPVFLAKQRRVERNAHSDVYLKQHQHSSGLTITEDDVRAYFESNIDRYQFPEQRYVFNIYKAVNDNRTREQARIELEALRERQRAGENFQVLAEHHSDSETRHRGGSLGAFERGTLSEDFDRVIFSMPAHTVSDVIMTADGAHLFFVGDVLDAQSNSFEDLAAVVFQDMMTERLLDQLEQAAADLPQPDPYQVPDSTTLQRQLRTAPEHINVLRIGDFSMTKAEFRAYVTEIRRQLGSRRVDDLPQKLIEELAYREVIFQHVRDEAVPDQIRDQLRSEERAQLVDHYLESKLAGWLARTPDKLRSHYENNRNRFSSPLRVSLTRLNVPLSESPAERMNYLELARPRLDRGEITLQDLADELQGELVSTTALSAARLSVLDPRAARFAFVLNEGMHSPPYRFNEGLSLFQVTKRIEPVVQPLAVVRPRVVEDYLQYYSSDIYRELSEALLNDHAFELVSEHLDAAFKAIALPGVQSQSAISD